MRTTYFTLRQYARRLGISHTAVNKAVKRGIITPNEYGLLMWSRRIWIGLQITIWGGAACQSAHGVSYYPRLMNFCVKSASKNIWDAQNAMEN